MQYDTIILELLSRIKTLEDDVAQLKNALLNRTTSTSASHSESHLQESPIQSTPYTKMTDAMIDCCYSYGKMAHENSRLDLWTLAEKAVNTTGMNKNSAYMYICAVKSMLEGSVYKRRINAKAMRKYFSNILAEYGHSGLSKAINAARWHADYLKTVGQPVDSIEDICREFQSRL